MEMIELPGTGSFSREKRGRGDRMWSTLPHQFHALPVSKGTGPASVRQVRHCVQIMLSSFGKTGHNQLLYRIIAAHIIICQIKLFNLIEFRPYNHKIFIHIQTKEKHIFYSFHGCRFKPVLH